MTNREVREWYLAEIATIPKLDRDWAKQGRSLKQRARKAWEIRHTARIAARGMMEDHEEVRLLRARDQRIYGSPDGPTFEQLLEEFKSTKLTNDQAYRHIMAGAQKTDVEATRISGATRRRRDLD